MDNFSVLMIERVKMHQKRLEEAYGNANETPKTPLQEPNVILQKYENSVSKSEPNLSKTIKIKPKETVSESNLNAKTLLYDSSFKENLSDTNLCKRSSNTKISSDLPSSPQSPTKTLNIQKENFNMEIKLTSADNVRVEVEIEERDESFEENSNNDDDKNDKLETCSADKQEVGDKPVIRENVKNRLQRLGKLYSGSDEIQLSSPISRTESKFCEESPGKEVKKPNVAGLGRLKALANTRNEWEDEMSASSSNKASSEAPKRSWKPPAPKPPVATTTSFTHNSKKGPAPQPPKTNSSVATKESNPQRSPIKNRFQEEDDDDDAKPVCWDNAVLASLESQGFTRTNSNSRLVYSYKKDETNKKSEEHLSELEEEEEEVVQSQVSKITAKFAETISEDSKKQQPLAIKPQSPVKPAVKSPLKSPVKFPSKSNLRCGDVINKAAMFEQQNQSPTKTKDPALMTVSERKALFEKNKGSALVPKAAFGMAAPIKQTPVFGKSSSSNNLSKASPEKSKSSSSPNKSSPTKAYIAESGGIASKMKALLEKKTTISQTQIVNKIQEQRQKDLDLLLNRYNTVKETEEVKESSEDDDTSDEESVTETTKMIPDRTVKIVQFKEKEIPPPPPLPIAKIGAPKRRSKGDSPKVREVLGDVKRIRISPPKSGRMYPCLSDIEASTEAEQETTTAEPSPDTSYEDNISRNSDEPNTSFGREILQVVTNNQTPQKRPILDDSTASDLSDILDGMDDYLDEAMAHDPDTDYTDEGPTPPKHGRSQQVRSVATPSHSFHYSKGSPSKYNSPVKQQKSPVKNSPKKETPGRNSPKKETPGRSSPKKETPGRSSPKKSTDLPTHVVDGETVLPLQHTVSFYRKQQAQGSRTPIRHISRQAVVPEQSPEEENENESIEVSEKIQDLMNTVTKQQTVISQASQALNLCCSTIEFSGSSEQVEAERLLLVATQRRQAALHEVQRLRVEGTLHPGGGNAVDKGTLLISDITLPLKKEYVRALSAAGGLGHHIVCLVRYAEHVIPTRLVSTVASPKDAPEMNLKIPGSVKLENIYSDFTVTVEVYSLQAQEELLPHEVKYHINTKKGGSKLTPKKYLKNDSKLVMPSIQSPAGPQAVRTSSFALMGYVVFSLQAINRKHWTLNKAPPMSPLDGNIQMKVNCELAVSVEHRGFLTMFDDVSGFGAWHRRWCLLKGHNLSYWKYPDDERKKAPIDSINLKISTTKNVGQVSRDICARPHTFLLETVRPAKSTDKDSLVTVCKGNKTMIRHLLSADTKEERIEWCEKFNKALEGLRLWGNNQ